MVNVTRLCCYSSRLICMISLACFLISGLFLLKIKYSSSKSDFYRTIIVKDYNSKKLLEKNPTDTYLSYICDKQSPFNYHSSILHSYCSKLPVPLNGWTTASKYKENDIGFLIFSNSISPPSKSIVAISDTWLAQVTHKYILNEISSLWLIANHSNVDHRLSSIQILIRSLEIIFHQQKISQKLHKWFYLGGDYTYINIDHVLKRLDEYDHNRPLFLGNSFNVTTCMDNQKHKHSIAYPSINAGLFISSKLMELMIPLLKEMNSTNIRMNIDVILTCFIYKLNVKLTNMSGYWSIQNNPLLESNDEQEKNFDPEPNNFQMINSDEMYDIDEFYSFLQIDRLFNDANWQELTDYIRRFLANHYQTLRIKRNIQKNDSFSMFNF